jgi:glucose-1-phosphate adenylyltransferase
MASMGNYLFSPGVLLDALEATHAAGGTDFGGHLLPSLIASHRLMAYDFTANIPAAAAADADPHYWRDVGTIDAYFAAHMDTQGPAPRFQLANQAWPIRAAAAPVDAIAPQWPFGGAQSPTVMARLSEVEQTILRCGVEVGERASLSRCIVGDQVTIGARCRLQNTIVETGNRLPDGFEAGFDAELDRQRWPVSDGGIVVVPRGSFPVTSGGLARYKITRPIHPIGAIVRPEPDRAGRSECPQDA